MRGERVTTGAVRLERVTMPGRRLAAVLVLVLSSVAGLHQSASASDGVPAQPASVLARTPDSVAGWGFGASGRLGNGATTDAHALVRVSATGPLAGELPSAVSAGPNNTCAVFAGAVYCWGSASFGMLGHGNLEDSAVPVAVDSTGVLVGKTVTAVAVGNSHACVLAAGEPYCWGNNGRGQLGDGTTAPVVDTVSPVDVSGALAGKSITSIAAGDMTTCVVASGAAYCWGMNAYGLLGNGAGPDALSPTAVDPSGPLSGRMVTAVSLAQTPDGGTFYGLPTPVCAVADARAFCWGDNTYGEAGGVALLPAQPVTQVGTTGPMSGLDVSSVSVGYQHACAIASGHAYCWGRNFYGELGNGTRTPADDAPTPQVPVAVSTSGAMGGTTVDALAADPLGTCALAASALYCWGETAFGLDSTPYAADPGEVGASGKVLAVSMGLNGGAVLARIDNTPPVAWMTGPASKVTLSTPIRFTWTATDSGGSGPAEYVVYARSGTTRTAWTSWTATSTTAAAATRGLTAGQTLCMAVRAIDHSGNVSGLSSARCITRPLDQTAASRDAHWWTPRASSYYGGTAAATRSHGATLTYSGARSVTRVAIVTRTGPTAGGIAVYIGSTRVANFVLTTNRWHSAVVITSGGFAARSGTVRFVVTSPTGRYVFVDGFAALP